MIPFVYWDNSRPFQLSPGIALLGTLPVYLLYFTLPISCGRHGSAHRPEEGQAEGEGAPDPHPGIGLPGPVPLIGDEYASRAWTTPGRPPS